MDLAAEGNHGRGHSEVLKVLCQHGARGVLCYAAKNDLRGMVTELISKGHDLEECDRVLVYDALRRLKGAIMALVRLCQGGALIDPIRLYSLRLYEGSIKALLRLY